MMGYLLLVAYCIHLSCVPAGMGHRGGLHLHTCTVMCCVDVLCCAVL